MTDITIRPIAPDDRADWSALWTAYLEFYEIGHKLIEAVYAQADTDGCPAVYWLTQDFNAEARKLYDRVGVLTPFIKYARP